MLFIIRNVAACVLRSFCD